MRQPSPPYRSVIRMRPGPRRRMESTGLRAGSATHRSREARTEADLAGRGAQRSRYTPICRQSVHPHRFRSRIVALTAPGGATNPNG